MTATRLPAPLRLEAVLRQLPDVDLLMPLRALVVTTSRAHHQHAPFLTVGKRLAQTGRIAEAIPHAVERFSGHVTKLYELGLVALDAQAHGDPDAAVRAFVEASRAETHIGREAAAAVWLEHALHTAENGGSRRSEVDVLRALGAHYFAAQAYEAAGRHLQRCVTVAEAEGEHAQAARASLALGAVSGALGATLGVTSWNRRALELAGAHEDLRGRAHLGLCDAHATHGDLAAAAQDLAIARTLLHAPAASEASEGLSRAVANPEAVAFEFECPTALALARTEARLALRMHLPEEAIVHYRTALVVALRGRLHPWLALHVRIELAQCLLDLDRLPDAEDEVRLAEEMAVVHGRSRELARLYVILGDIRGRQGDETGFVFFEQAIMLARDTLPTPRIKAHAYLAYARFRARFGEHGEAARYVARARKLIDGLAEPAAIARLDAEWGLTAAPR